MAKTVFGAVVLGAVFMAAPIDAQGLVNEIRGATAMVSR